MPLKKRISTDNQTKTRNSAKAGLPPGSMVYVGKKRKGEVVISAYNFNEQLLEVKEAISASEAATFQNTDSVTWINVDGIHNPGLIDELCESFGIHPLTREDIVNTSLRPKMEEYPEYIYVIMKMLYHDDKGRIVIEQVSFILGKDYVITFQEQVEDVFQPVRERIMMEGSRIRKRKSDYLLYALMDVILGNYFVVLEDTEEKIELLEDEVNEGGEKEVLMEIQNMKKELIYLRRSVFPLRDLISQLLRTETRLILSKTQVYYRDLFDHIFQVAEIVETQRDLLSGLHDLYLTEVSNKMNEIMKVLTIISTIFIPITFIAGIYGMNFDHMPELHYKEGYYLVWGLMGVISLGMVAFFRRKKWL